MKNFLIVIAGILLLNAGLLYSGGFAYIKETFEPIVGEPNVRPEVVDVFRTTLESEVIKEIGMPIEGFEPAMFLAVFPGLVESDFDGVQASIGRYVLAGGRLVYETDDSQLIHSAAGAINRNGIETLYRNVAKRSGFDLANGATLTEVMSVLTGG